MITTYGELKAEVARWTDREDPDFLGRVPSFVRLAESRIYRNLRTRENEFVKTWTETDAPLTPLDLPGNFREIKTLNLDGRALQNVSPLDFRNRQAEGTAGETQFFTQIERKLHLLNWRTEAPVDPEEWGTFTIELIYWGTESITEMAYWGTPTNPNQEPPSGGTAPATMIREDDATSRLLQVAPDVYLYGALHHAFNYLQEPGLAQQALQSFSLAMAQVEAEYAEADLTGSPLSISSVYFDGRR